MYWTLELASYLEDAPWPATKDELIGNTGALLFTTTSDVNGKYSFGRIDGGTYSLTVIPPVSLAGTVNIQVYTVSFNSDTDLDVILAIIWGSNNITFNDPYTFW